MYRLFRTLAQKDLQKLSELRDALHSNIQNEIIRLTDKKEIYLFPDGRAWNYQESEVKDKEGNVYIEAVFSDVTKQYHEKINLTRQTEKLKEISRELRYLSDNVLILTREREVLAAKTKLHDQMGAGLTAIRQSLAQENADYSNAVRLLRQAVKISTGCPNNRCKGSLHRLLTKGRRVCSHIYSCHEGMSDKRSMSCRCDRAFYNDARR